MTPWPPTAALRASLAKHLVETAVPVVDPVAFVQMCSAGLKPTYANGLCFLDARIAFEATFVPSATACIDPLRLVLLALHVLWQGFKGQAPVLASFVQREHMAAPTSMFWAELYATVAWILTPPALICEAMQVGRPDLQLFVCRSYMHWLHRVKNPAAVHDALSLLLKEPMAYTNWSQPWADATAWLCADGVQTAAVHNKPIEACITSRLQLRKPCAVRLNGCIGLRMAVRDQVLLVLRHLFADGWLTHGVPSDAPAAYHALAEAQPFLFDASVPVPPVPFDELVAI